MFKGRSEIRGNQEIDSLAIQVFEPFGDLFHWDSHYALRAWSSLDYLQHATICPKDVLAIGNDVIVVGSSLSACAGGRSRIGNGPLVQVDPAISNKVKDLCRLCGARWEAKTIIVTSNLSGA